MVRHRLKGDVIAIKGGECKSSGVSRSRENGKRNGLNPQAARHDIQGAIRERGKKSGLERMKWIKFTGRGLKPVLDQEETENQGGEKEESPTHVRGEEKVSMRRPSTGAYLGEEKGNKVAIKKPASMTQATILPIRKI